MLCLASVTQHIRPDIQSTGQSCCSSCKRSSRFCSSQRQAPGGLTSVPWQSGWWAAWEVAVYTLLLTLYIDFCCFMAATFAYYANGRWVFKRRIAVFFLLIAKYSPLVAVNVYLICLYICFFSCRSVLRHFTCSTWTWANEWLSVKNLYRARTCHLNIHYSRIS